MTNFRRVLLLPFCLFGCAAGSVYSQPANLQGSTVIVEAQDAQGRLLRSALGFVWDDTAVVTSLKAVNGAAKLTVRTSSFKSEAKQLVSSNNSLDLALIKTVSDLPFEPSLALMDTLATGDMVYFFSNAEEDLRVTQSRVAGWTDSGRGYEYLTLEPKAAVTASPLFNSHGRIAGWTSSGGTVSIRAIYQSLANKETAVPLTTLAGGGKYWDLYRPTPPALHGEPSETESMKRVQGTSQFPFEILVPGNWSVDATIHSNRYLMMALDAKSGIAMAIRVVPKPTEDLMEAFQEVETRIFDGASRAELIPFSADQVTGMRAYYEDPVSPGYSTSVFCALVNHKLYVVTVTSPQQHAEQLQPLIDEIFASFRLP